MDFKKLLFYTEGLLQVKNFCEQTTIMGSNILKRMLQYGNKGPIYETGANCM